MFRNKEDSFNWLLFHLILFALDFIIIIIIIIIIISYNFMPIYNTVGEPIPWSLG